MIPFHNRKSFAAAALALTFLVAGCVDHDGRYSSRSSDDGYYRNGERYQSYEHYLDEERRRSYKERERYPSRNSADGYYRDGRRYHSYEHYLDEERNRRHKEQEKAAWDR